MNHILTDYESNNFQGDTAQLKNNFNSHSEDYELRLVKGLLDVDFGWYDNLLTNLVIIWIINHPGYHETGWTMAGSHDLTQMVE